MLRRLHPEQPDSFAFTPANQAWAEAQMTKFPEGRQASAVIPLLWRAQEQEGWLTRPAIEEIGRMLDMAYIRVLEVATFYFMFQLQPVGSVAHIQICGTTSCMICGAEDLVAVCRDKIAKAPHQLSADGKFSWEEVECLGACANAPMAQIGKDYYEDLTADKLAALLDDLAAGNVPVPGPQNGRYAAEPASGLTSLTDHFEGRPQYNASAGLATDLGDTIKRIDGTEVPLIAPWARARNEGASQDSARDDLMPPSARTDRPTPGPKPSRNAAADDTGVTKQEAQETEKGRPDAGKTAPKGKDVSGDEISADDGHAAAGTAPKGQADRAQEAKETKAAEIAPEDAVRPAALESARDGKPDDLKMIKGVGPKLEQVLHDLGFFHFDQVAAWTPAEIAWVDQNLEGFHGRVTRDDWVSQAKILATGGETEFSKRADY
ncbi:NADH-quinone oxidoreductase subunit E [Oceaniglobus trochenteri]|uniref:NADH-quinone oxidoreductase subunit E n=1 Tax=Oceaniglobus trochenteri TaxID=2763260 RepID=UPI001CFF8009|nr:NADH-quinone oxidoreductase subunit E [Oceaniglobus trochenteri]